MLELRVQQLLAESSSKPALHSGRGPGPGKLRRPSDSALQRQSPAPAAPASPVALPKVLMKRREFSLARSRTLDKAALAKVPVPTLQRAVRNNNLEQADALINREIDGDPTWKMTLAPLLISAILSGHREMAMLLIERGAYLGPLMNQQCSALHIATADGDEDIVAALLAAKADVNAADAGGKTPLMYAGEHGNMKLVHCLLEQGAAIDQANFDQHTALYLAVAKRRHDVVALLLSRGARVEDPHHNFKPALCAAVLASDARLIDMLVEHGNATIHFVQPDGTTALAIAVRNKAVHFSILEMLSKRTQPYLHTLDFKDRYPLNLAIMYRSDRVFSRLRADCWSIGYSNEVCDFPLSVAAKYCRLEIMRTLLEWGARYRACKSDGITALSVAIRAGSLPAVNLLLDAGADMDVKDAQQKTPLIHAFEHGENRANVVDLLIYRASREPDPERKIDMRDLQKSAFGFLDELAALTANELATQLKSRALAHQYVKKLCLNNGISNLAATALVNELQQLPAFWNRLGGTAAARKEDDFLQMDRQKEMLFYHILARSGFLHQHVMQADETEDYYRGTRFQQHQGGLPQKWSWPLSRIALAHCQALIDLGVAAVNASMELLQSYLLALTETSPAQLGACLRSTIGLHEQVVQLVLAANSLAKPGPLQLRSFADQFLASLESPALATLLEGFDDRENHLVMMQIEAVREICLGLGR
ncbi:MAG: ankyrin repeat domain-containing protein [Janthinobacterium lividum]